MRALLKRLEMLEDHYQVRVPFLFRANPHNVAANNWRISPAPACDLRGIH